MSNARFGLRVRNGLVRGITEGQQAIFLDPDAAAFLTAAGITDSTITSAIDTLVVSLKNAGLWTKMKAIYPFVGGTASTHKWNLKDPRDLDAAFRLIFSGGSTHSSTGWRPNGTNGYANTYLNPISILSLNNSSHGLYSGPNNVSNGSAMGAQSSPFGLSNLYITYFGNTSFCINDGGTTSIPNTDSSGFVGLSRISATQTITSLRNTIYLRNVNSNALPNNNFYLGVNSNINTSTPDNNWSPWEHRFTWIGDGLTQTDLGNLFTIVTTYQTTLGRQV